MEIDNIYEFDENGMSIHFKRPFNYQIGNTDLLKFFKKVENGDNIDEYELLHNLSNFKNIIIWGCSALGASIYEYLTQKKIKISYLWDIRADEIKNINGKKVSLPFSDDENDKENTIIIICISNNVIQKNIRLQLKSKGYYNVFLGGHLYMGLICPSSKDTGINNIFCLKESPCLKIFCPRQVNLMSYKYPPKNREYPLNMNSVTLIVNQKCNLSCKYCTSYMSQYNPQDKKNFPVENIIRDIDNFFSTVDSVSSITVMGGEPFLHPDISLIIKALLKYEKFGFISIATNGVCPIKPEQLEGLSDTRICVSFNNYLKALPENFTEIFKKNIELVKNHNVYYAEGSYMNEWAIPSTLYDTNVNESSLIKKIFECTQAISYTRCHQLKDGKIFPCDFANSVHFLGVADYSDEYIDLTIKDNLRERLYKYIHAPFYKVCGHCRFQIGSTKGAAEQGKLDFINLPAGTDKFAYVPGKI
ncbi:MAG: radical SAM protein [Treponema sp.]|nr:radical SAM protein [Treponema sp.]MCL2272306.1 radical SAM protein [Treponema sp.]